MESEPEAEPPAGSGAKLHTEPAVGPCRRVSDGLHLTATTPVDLTPVHQCMMPGIWSRLQLETFPENWLVLRVSIPGGAGDKRMLRGRPSAGAPQAFLERYGRGGLRQVAEVLAASAGSEFDSAVRYAACRVSVVALSAAMGLGGLPPPRTATFVWLSWFGPAVNLADRDCVLQRDRQMLQDYFSTAIELPSAYTATQLAVDGAALYQSLSAVATSTLHGTLGSDCALDFENTTAVVECTHYQDDDTVDGTSVQCGRHMRVTVNENSGEEETVTDDFYSEYFIFQLETGCYDAETVMDYLRRHRGDVREAAAEYRRELAGATSDRAEETSTDMDTLTIQQRQVHQAQLQQHQRRLSASGEVSFQDSGSESTSDCEFWTVLLDAGCTNAADHERAPVCAICLAGLHPQSAFSSTTTEHELRNVAVQLRCSHAFHRHCIDRCVEDGSLCCPLCRTVFYTTARRHVMEATADAEATAAAVAASADRHRQRLQQRLQERRTLRAGGRGND